jgi:hypothetical protein
MQPWKKEMFEDFRYIINISNVEIRLASMLQRVIHISGLLIKKALGGLLGQNKIQIKIKEVSMYR